MGLGSALQGVVPQKAVCLAPGRGSPGPSQQMQERGGGREPHLTLPQEQRGWHLGTWEKGTPPVRLQLVWPLWNPGSFSTARSVNRTEAQVQGLRCRPGAMGKPGPSWEASGPS